ncbi:MAG: NADH-quinone oxidoreductase subunit C [Sulfolobales archaeon]|nr:NADH-quinone oxidoreductase subunit C [Sulfolobales archaeon]MDW8083338.1 NADH-quinone oxidoreductase subunit C [Sulfolobales archaeon]
MSLLLGDVRFEEVSPRRFVATVTKHELRKTVEVVVKEDSYLSTITAVDIPKDGKIELNYIFWSVKYKAAIVVKVLVDRSDPVVPSISDIVRGAVGSEVEVYDLMGVIFQENGRLRRGFLAPEDIVAREIYPLRKDSGV